MLGYTAIAIAGCYSQRLEKIIIWPHLYLLTALELKNNIKVMKISLEEVDKYKFELTLSVYSTKRWMKISKVIKIMSKNELAGVDIHNVLELLELISLSISVIIEGCPNVQADKPNGLEDACTHFDGIKDRVLFVSFKHSFMGGTFPLVSTFTTTPGWNGPKSFRFALLLSFE